MKINWLAVVKILSVLLILVGILMWTSLFFSFYFGGEDADAIGLSGLSCVLPGLLGYALSRHQSGGIRKREGYLIVALGWLTMTAFGMLPYLFSGVIPEVPKALFESISGMTTTGASVLTDIESTPKGILFWRSLTQWIGGMGIIVLTVAIFPLLGFGGIELFVAEAPGPTSDKIHPRIRETAKRLWLIYVGLTVCLGAILWLMGMNLYESINHALTTMATGGFSTRNASMMAFGPSIQYVVIFFMFLAGVNYSILYFSLKGRWKDVWRSDELRAYLGLIAFLAIGVTAALFSAGAYSLEQSFRNGLFQIVSLITTTGFVSADYSQWSAGLQMLFFLLLFAGACAGSTSGGIKVVRHLVFFKNSLLEFKRILHPHAIVPLRISGEAVRGRVITHVIIFLLVYLAIYAIGVVVLAVFGLDFSTALGGMATCLGNVGPGMGELGPVDNFSQLGPGTHLFLCFVMILGRLELFTILVLFMPYFWRLN
ncbi:MAG: TrkH family potassium uptake protein [Bacteroidota bacterium]